MPHRFRPKIQLDMPHSNNIHYSERQPKRPLTRHLAQKAAAIKKPATKIEAAKE